MADKPEPKKDANGRISKSDADYRYAEDPNKCCGCCDMLRGKGPDFTCTLVRGIIFPQYTCDYFEPKETK